MYLRCMTSKNPAEVTMRDLITLEIAPKFERCTVLRPEVQELEESGERSEARFLKQELNAQRYGIYQTGTTWLEMNGCTASGKKKNARKIPGL